MISRSDIKKRSYRLLEIAIVISFILHFLLGGVALYQNTTVGKLLQRLVKNEKKEDKLVALSTVITIEKRTAPRSAPPAPPQPKTAPVEPQPKIQPRVATLAQPVTKPVPREVPVPESKPQELSKIVPHAKEHVAVNKPQVVARIAVPKRNPGQFTQAQINEMSQRFSQTIDAARAANDPTHVTATAPPATMKRAHLDISGVNEMLSHGEGYLIPQTMTPMNVNGDSHGMCYYVNFQVSFSDGSFDAGPVYWPICYTRRQDPFRNNFQHFPLPGPPVGWTPSPSEWPVIGAHRVLRAYFPFRFPDDPDNGN
jgi:hypothetical protein